MSDKRFIVAATVAEIPDGTMYLHVHDVRDNKVEHHWFGNQPDKATLFTSNEAADIAESYRGGTIRGFQVASVAAYALPSRNSHARDSGA